MSLACQIADFPHTQKEKHASLNVQTRKSEILFDGESAIMMQFTVSKSMKWLVGTALLVSTVGAGTVWSFFRTAEHAVRERVRDAIPVTFELQRLEQLTRDLIPEIQSNQKVAAQLDVEVEYLQREVEAIGKSQVNARSQMEKLRRALDSPSGTHEFGGRPFSKAEIELDLNRRLERFENDRRIQ